MVSPKALAWAAELKLAAPVAPPRDSVIILPLAWQAWIDEARNEQSGSSVPGKFEPLEGLQVYSFLHISGSPWRVASVFEQLTLAMFNEGRPPAPWNTFTNAKGMASMTSSWSGAS